MPPVDWKKAQPAMITIYLAKAPRGGAGGLPQLPAMKAHPVHGDVLAVAQLVRATVPVRPAQSRSESPGDSPGQKGHVGAFDILKLLVLHAQRYAVLSVYSGGADGPERRAFPAG